MTERRAGTSLWLYSVVMLIAISVILYVFLRNFQKGEQAGQATPQRPEDQRTAGAVVNEQALAKDTGLATKGRGSFQLNCVSCHGATGLGDGTRAASINPKPRNYKTESFKFGSDIVSIHNTILRGSPGTSMPSFALLPLEETWALAHYVRTLIPSPPPITDELVASLPSGNVAAGSAGTAAPAANPAAPPAGPRIPILLAMERMAKPAQASPRDVTFDKTHPGAALYSQHCAECHGVQGEGKARWPITVAPYQYYYSGTLAGSTAPWTSNRNLFAEIVVKGLPGSLMPGQGTLTRQQIDDLHSFLRSLHPIP